MYTQFKKIERNLKNLKKKKKNPKEEREKRGGKMNRKEPLTTH